MPAGRFPEPKQKPTQASSEHSLRPPTRRQPPPQVQPQGHDIVPPAARPIPLLQNNGMGHIQGIQDFNQRVQQAVDAHKQGVGYTPSPHLVLDLVRSKVPPDQWPSMFSVGTPDQSRTQGILAQHKRDNPDDYFVTRPDGVMHPSTVLDRMISNVQAPAPDIRTENSPVAPPPTLNQLQKKYPMVSGLPLPNFSAVNDAIKYLNSKGGPAAAQPPADFQHYKLKGGSQAQDQGAVSTILEAKKSLTEQSGIAFSTGPTFNTDDLKLLGNWMKSKDYFQRQLKFQADQNHQSVNQYVKSWYSKQHAVAHNGLLSHFFMAMPQQLFGHDGVIGSFEAVPGYLTSGSNNPVDVSLHSLVRGAGLGLDAVGGTISQAKANAAAGEAFFKAVTPREIGGKGQTLEQAKQSAAHVLAQNPSWLRILYPDLADHPHGLLAATDVITNVAGDFILLRKPKFTGERVAAGSIEAAQKSTHLNWAAHWSYRDMSVFKKDGIGRAASKLGSSPAARALVARAEPLIRAGRMTEQQYRQHVAELYANWHTTLDYGEPPPVAVEPVAPTHPPDFVLHVAGRDREGFGATESPRIPFVYSNETGQLAHTSDFTHNVTHSKLSAEFATRTGSKMFSEGFMNVPEDSKKMVSGEIYGEGGGGTGKYGFQRGITIHQPGEHADLITRLHEKYPDMPIYVGNIETPLSSLKIRQLKKIAERKAVPEQTVPVPDVFAPTPPTITGSILEELRTGQLPTPGIPGRTWLTTKTYLRDSLDRYDRTARAHGYIGGDTAADAVLGVRSLVAHAYSRQLGYFDPTLPESLFNFIMKYKLGDDTIALANRMESSLVRFQGRENVAGIQSVQRKLEEIYYKKFSDKDRMPPGEPFDAVLSTEAPSRFLFPGGGAEKKLSDTRLGTAWNNITSNTLTVNRTLNKIGQYQARVIIAGLSFIPPFVGGLSLAWKHTFGDGGRALLAGLLHGFDPGSRAAWKEINALADASPQFSRRLGVYQARTTISEARWALGRAAKNEKSTFQTGDFFDKKNYMTGAGSKLRGLMDDPALEAYQQGGDSILQLVLNDKTYRGLWKSTARKAQVQYLADLNRRIRELGGEPMARLTRADREDVLTAEDYAKLVTARYQDLEAGLQSSGLTLDDAKSFYNTVRGAYSDPKLGKWISDHQVDFHVQSGDVEDLNTFDSWTGRWVGNVIMRPNKFWRGKLGQSVLSSTYAEMRAAGATAEEAFSVAEAVGQKVVKYHMLDFANRLQVEQDLRWLSYFATKHRLYWKWVISTVARNPAAVAVISDIKNQLNGNGAISFHIGQHQLSIPVARLVWVPGREYPETSLIGQSLENFVRAGFDFSQLAQTVTQPGNTVTRSDTAMRLGWRLIRSWAGNSTYTDAVSGLDKRTAQGVRRAINEYQMAYFNQHGSYDTPSNAVRSVLWHQTALEYWRANLPLPVQLTTSQEKKDSDRKLLDQYMSLTDVKARRKFLHDHKELSDHFGVYQDPKIYVHDRDFFNRYTTAHDAYVSARVDLFSQAKADGWSAKLQLQKRKLDDQFTKFYNSLLVDDARKSGVFVEKGQVPDGRFVPYGYWGRLAAQDPQLNPQHVLNTLFPKLKDQDKIYGVEQKRLQAELNHLDDPQYQKIFADPQELKTHRRELIQALQAFQGFPSDALGKVQRDYQHKYVGPYFATSDARYKAIKNLPAGSGQKEQDLAWAKYRDWRDQQDQPVTVDGIKFPSPVRLAWATLDPVTRRERLSKLASGTWEHLTDYEKSLLGHPAAPNSSHAWAYLAQLEADYQHKNAKGLDKNQKLAIARQVDAQPGYKGFLADYQFSLKPKIVRFESTSLYTSMPKAARESFDLLGETAKKFATALNDPNRSSEDKSQLKISWKEWIENQAATWLQLPANKQLKQYLVPYGPNFLTTLISSGG